ncbi:hypothetical protein N6L24_14570 [Cognatishimia sp. SS12]|uniref:hypothetical protein n=1 Tax=Cognatishimia sp. SS12 TaxID=2979465 RepID=UPI00232C99FA|nr:hypothetical protein [Cognatishimia sp. SS12]MDC0739510.1 hypothetical protein [Cognatishimia sp. SS12]
MQAAHNVDKTSVQALPEQPRMMGNADVALILQILEKCPPDACLIEFGSWLGGVSRLLAEHGRLHVVDHFIWSDLNASAHPDLLAPGASFRPMFEVYLSAAGQAATVHECEFEAFEWTGGALDFCLIDGPRDLPTLWACLRQVQADLKPDSHLLIKHGLNPARLDLMCWVGRLLQDGVARLVQTGQPRWCNIAVLTPGPNWGDLPAYLQESAQGGALALVDDPWGGKGFALVQLARRLRDDRARAAFQGLAALPRNAAHIRDWDVMEHQLDLPAEVQMNTAIFAELLSFQNSQSDMKCARPVDQSLTWALRGFWATQSQRADGWSFEPNLLAQAFAAGDMALPALLGADCLGQDIVEIGRDLGMSGAGFLAAGAKSYTGFELGALGEGARDTAAGFASVSYHSALTPPQDMPPIDLILLRDVGADHSLVAPLLTRLAPKGANVPEIIHLEDGKLRAVRSQRTAHWKREKAR